MSYLGVLLVYLWNGHVKMCIANIHIAMQAEKQTIDTHMYNCNYTRMQIFSVQILNFGH